MGCFSCFAGNQKQQHEEEERKASAEIRLNVLEAAMRREDEFEKSAAGRAAQVQRQRMARQKAINKNSREANKGQSDRRRRRWVASVASTELKSNNVRKKRDKPPPKLVPEPPKLPCDEKKSLKNLQLEELLKLKYSKWLNKKLIVILTKENLFSSGK